MAGWGALGGEEAVGASRGPNPGRAARAGTARAGADQRDAAGFGGGGLVLGSAQQRIEIGWRGFALWIADGKGRERLPKPPPARRRKPRGLHRLAPAAGGAGPAGENPRGHPPPPFAVPP